MLQNLFWKINYVTFLYHKKICCTINIIEKVGLRQKHKFFKIKKNPCLIIVLFCTLVLKLKVCTAAKIRVLLL